MVIHSVCQLAKKQECIIVHVNVSCPGGRRAGMKAENAQMNSQRSSLKVCSTPLKSKVILNNSFWQLNCGCFGIMLPLRHFQWPSLVFLQIIICLNFLFEVASKKIDEWILNLVTSLDILGQWIIFMHSLVFQLSTPVDEGSLRLVKIAEISNCSLKMENIE